MCSVSHCFLLSGSWKREEISEADCKDCSQGQGNHNHVGHRSGPDKGNPNHDAWILARKPWWVAEAGSSPEARDGQGTWQVFKLQAHEDLMLHDSHASIIFVFAHTTICQHSDGSKNHHCHLLIVSCYGVVQCISLLVLFWISLFSFVYFEYLYCLLKLFSCYSFGPLVPFYSSVHKVFL